MGFDTGSISFRAFYLQPDLPRDHIDQFSQDAAPSLDALGRDSISGWVTGRHLLDRHITDENATLGSYLRLTLMKAERKVPAPLLHAHCVMEELAAAEAQGVPYLKREERSRIRGDVTARLLPDMPPHLSGIPMACRRNGDVMFSAALSENQLDAFVIAIKRTLDIDAIPVTPETAALRRKHKSVTDVAPTSFSPECADTEVNAGIGLDFMTWLWFFSEARRGLLETAEGSFEVQLEGPLTFVMEGHGAHEARLRKGEPLLSGEAKTALLSGKKLNRARVHLVRDKQEWTADVDAESFVFSGLTVEREQGLDRISAFESRMRSIHAFLAGFLSLFDLFLDERLDATRWSEARQEIHKWVTSRDVQR
jgi:hypothetical protein